MGVVAIKSGDMDSPEYVEFLEKVNEQVEYLIQAAKGENPPSFERAKTVTTQDLADYYRPTSMRIGIRGAVPWFPNAGIFVKRGIPHNQAVEAERIVWSFIKGELHAAAPQVARFLLDRFVFEVRE